MEDFSRSASRSKRRWRWARALPLTLVWAADVTAMSAIAAMPSARSAIAPIVTTAPSAYSFPLRKSRLPDLLQGLRHGKDAFLAEVQRGGFIALTGVEPRQPIHLLEGATYRIGSDNGVTFVLSNGLVVPPLSRAAYDKIRDTLPTAEQSALDDKFYWHLRRNPAIPLIAEGLNRGQYGELVSDRVFDTDEYYLKPFLGYLFWAAQKANVSLHELLPLVETHLLTLEYPYLRPADLNTSSGTVRSFYKFEQDLTNKQYLMRSLLTTPLEPWARLEAIAQVEAATTKQDYTNSDTTSTTISLGRLPLPTPTAAEDTPGVHALNIAHLVNQGIALFPPDVQQAALDYDQRYQQQLTSEAVLQQQIQTFVADHGVEILTAIANYYDNDFWVQIGLTTDLSRRSVNQMDTSRLLGIFASRIEGAAKWPVAESYPLARQHFITFFRKNSPGLSESELLTVLLCDQAFNPRLWRTLKRFVPQHMAEIDAIQQTLRALEAAYIEAADQESVVFRSLQRHRLDISTQAFSLLSVAMAKRLSDLMYEEFQPGDRRNANYLRFTRALYPLLRDMPDLNKQWGSGQDIKRYGLDNYVVPNLTARTAEDAPTLAALGDLWFKMVSNSDLNRWDAPQFMKLLSTAYNLSANNPPAKLSAEQVALLPLVEKYRPELKRIAGADGSNAPAVLHGHSHLDFRISSWPRDRTPNPPRVTRINAESLQQLFPQLSAEDANNMLWRLSDHSGEVSLSLPLILLNNPLFVRRADGAIDLLFEYNGRQLTFPKISHHLESLYAPAFMTRIALPRSTDQAYVDALNQVIRRTHALYGGYTSHPMSLPPPLQSLPSE